MRTLAALAFVSLAVLAQDPVKPVVVEAKARNMGLAKPITMTAESEVYGAPLAGKEAVTLAALHKDAKAWNGKQLQLRGKVDGVCMKKGCWMVVKDGQDEIRVRFTDYKFFVPMDVAGRDVAAEGTFTVKTETEAERRHYAEDAGKSKEEIAKIVGDITVVGFTADAVQIGVLPALPEKKEGCCGDTEKKEGGACPCSGKTEGEAPKKDGGCTGCEGKETKSEEKKSG